ncbi:MAG: hypothetical protein ABR987_11990 [Terracidiphilus sp.]|jgi:hypothetical protein
MAQFRTEREAKEYLAGRIVEEAKREGAPLTEVERKMLYFTESGWTLPDIMAVNEEFERDYDQNGYEQKIGGLAARIRARDAAESGHDQAKWDEAVAKLSEGDHYLLVLIGTAGATGKLSSWLPVLSGPVRRPPGDAIRLILMAIVCGLVLMLFVILKNYLKDRFHR